MILNIPTIHPQISDANNHIYKPERMLNTLNVHAEKYTPEEMEKKLDEYQKKRNELQYYPMHLTFIDNLKNLFSYNLSYIKIMIVFRLNDTTLKLSNENDVRSNMCNMYLLYSLIFPDIKIDISRCRIECDDYIKTSFIEFVNNNHSKFVNIDFTNVFTIDNVLNDIIYDSEKFNIISIAKFDGFNEINKSKYDNIVHVSKLLKTIIENFNTEQSKCNIKSSQIDITSNIKQIPIVKPIDVVDKIPEEDIIGWSTKNESVTDFSFSLFEKNDVYTTYATVTKAYHILYNTVFGRVLIIDSLEHNMIKNEEFIMLRDVTFDEYNLLTKYNIDELLDYECLESDINVVKKFVNDLFNDHSEYIINEQIKEYIDRNYIITTNINDRIKFSVIYADFSNKDLISTVKFAESLKTIGLLKKRYGDGIYWYGLIVR